MKFSQITKVGFLQIGIYSIDSIYVIWCDIDNWLARSHPNLMARHFRWKYVELKFPQDVRL